MVNIPSKAREMKIARSKYRAGPTPEKAVKVDIISPKPGFDSQNPSEAMEEMRSFNNKANGNRERTVSPNTLIYFHLWNLYLGKKTKKRITCEARMNNP
jgi:hypothetical protein